MYLAGRSHSKVLHFSPVPGREFFDVPSSHNSEVHLSIFPVPNAGGFFFWGGFFWVGVGGGGGGVGFGFVLCGGVGWVVVCVGVCWGSGRGLGGG